MTKGEKKSDSKKKDLVRAVNKESEEKWKGLENKVWVVAEFGFYVVLLAFTIFAVGYNSGALLNSKKVIEETEPKYVETGYETIYYDVANQCSDLDNCMIELEENYQGSEISIHYDVANGVGALVIGDINVSTKAISEFALLKNGYVATFGTNDNNNLITYYDVQGNVAKEYETVLSSTGKLDSDVGVYAICSNNKLNVIRYNIQSDGNFYEETINSENNTRCS